MTTANLFHWGYVFSIPQQPQPPQQHPFEIHDVKNSSSILMGQNQDTRENQLELCTRSVIIRKTTLALNWGFNELDGWQKIGSGKMWVDSWQMAGSKHILEAFGQIKWQGPIYFWSKVCSQVITDFQFSRGERKAFQLCATGSFPWKLLPHQEI